MKSPQWKLSKDLYSKFLDRFVYCRCKLVLLSSQFFNTFFYSFNFYSNSIIPFSFERMYITCRLLRHFVLKKFGLIGRPIHSALYHIEAKSFVYYYKEIRLQTNIYGLVLNVSVIHVRNGIVALGLNHVQVINCFILLLYHLERRGSICSPPAIEK